MDLKQLLARIDAGLVQLNARAAAGEDVGAELAQMTRAQAQARGALAKQAGDDPDADALRSLMANAHGASRFAPEGASADALAQLAAGGDVAGLSLAPVPGQLGGDVALLGDGRKLFPSSPEEARRMQQLGAAHLVRGVKAMAEGTPSAGGYAVPVQYVPGLMALIRSRSAVLSMGVTTVPVDKELDLTSIATGASASFVAENANLPVSEMTLAQAPVLIPKEMGTLLPVSNKLLRNAPQEVADAIYADLAEVLGLRLDLAFIQGTGSGAEPLGIKSKATLPAPSFGTNGRTPTYDDLKAIVAKSRAANAPFRKPGWIFNQRLLETLETVKDTTGRYLADSGLLEFDETGGGGKLLDFPFRTTSQIPVTATTGTSNDTSYILWSSDWQDCWVGVDQEITVETSREAAYTPDGGTTWIGAWGARQTVFRATASMDVGLRRPGLFSATTGVRP